jgi:hypothetical protein
MKKVSILFLLTVVLASFAFAIEGVGDFTGSVELGLDNVGGGNKGALAVSINPAIKFARSFGGFGISAKLSDTVYIPTDEVKNGTDKIGDDLSFNVTPSYSLAAGPGELGFALGLQLNVPLTDDGYGVITNKKYGIKHDALFFRVDPAISYGLDAGFGALAFELGTDHIQLSKIHGDAGDAYGVDAVGVYFQAGVDFPFGFGLWVKPVLSIATEDKDDTELTNFDFDLHYAITEQIAAGVETSIPTGENGIKDGGITATPRVDLSFGALGAYVKVELSGIASDGDIQIKPILGASYKF